MRSEGLCRALGSLPILPLLPPLFYPGGSLAVGTLTGICMQPTLGCQIQAHGKHHYLPVA